MFTIFRDAAIIIAAVTALAYFFGNSHLYLYWRFIGLNRVVHPDATLEEVLLRGGCCVLVGTLIAFIIYLYRWTDPRRYEDTRSSSLLIMQNKILILCMIMLVFTLLFNYTYAWVRSRQFRSEMIKVQNIVLESGRNIPNSSELAFLGKMGSYVIFKRVDGHNQGEIIVIADSDVKSITMR